MPHSPQPSAAARPFWRRRGTAIAGVGGVVALVVALALFQPWKLWIDDKVDEAAPEGAVPATVANVSPTTDAPTSGSTAVPSRPSTTSTTVPSVEPTSFISIDHTTTGTATILQTDDGTRYLRFEDLRTDNGPDLKVYLSTNPADGPEGQFDDDFVNLGTLKGNIGSQNYEIPPGTDLSRFASVVIWCDRFNSGFGAARLPG